MSEINLLPWRAALRAQRVRYAKIFGLSFGAVLLGGVLVYKIYPHHTIPPAVPIQSGAVHNKHLDNEIARIHYVGYVHQGTRTWALLLFPDGETQEVEVGTQLVWLNAKITAITEQHVTLVASDHQARTLRMLH